MQTPYVEEARFSLRELVEASGISARNIRYYIEQGLIDPALGRGRSRYFTSAHLQQVELVARMRAERLSLEEIRARLMPQRVANAAPRDTWERITVHPDLELHLRSTAPESVRALAEQMAQSALAWFGGVEDEES